MGEDVSYWIADCGALGRVRLAATDIGLCKLALGRETDEVFKAWLVRGVGSCSPTLRMTPLIERAFSEIRAYVSAELQSFGTPLDLRGTSFQRRVWAQVMRIPYGTTVSYSEIAMRIGRPRSVRAVGAANGSNPLPLFVPCHRVVGTDGALRGYGGGLELKQALLDLESGMVL